MLIITCLCTKYLICWWQKHVVCVYMENVKMQCNAERLLLLSKLWKQLAVWSGESQAFSILLLAQSVKNNCPMRCSCLDPRRINIAYTYMTLEQVKNKFDTTFTGMQCIAMIGDRFWEGILMVNTVSVQQLIWFSSLTNHLCCANNVLKCEFLFDDTKFTWKVSLKQKNKKRNMNIKDIPGCCNTHLLLSDFYYKPFQYPFRLNEV